METHEPANNQSDVAASMDRDNLAKEGIRKFNEIVTAAFRHHAAAQLPHQSSKQQNYIRLEFGE